MTLLPQPTGRRCPRCFKRLMEDMGQRDMVGDATVGECELILSCLNCGYSERDTNWQPVKRPVVVGPSLAERLHHNRTEGWDVPMKIDTSPFPEEEV